MADRIVVPIDQHIRNCEVRLRRLEERTDYVEAEFDPDDLAEHRFQMAELREQIERLKGNPS